MIFDFLSPISDAVLDLLESMSSQSIGNQLLKHTHDDGVPSLHDAGIAFFAVLESNDGSVLQLDGVRKNFYQLYIGNWDVHMVDLGDIFPGDAPKDTHFVVQRLSKELLRQGIIPVLLSGNQAFAYSQYRAYDQMDQMVNLVNIDHRFDLGELEKQLAKHSFVGKIVVDQPYNLFNYSTIGCQVYFNSQEEVDLMEQLFFETYRLGDVVADLSVVEPVLRDADMVCIDLGAIKASNLSYYHNSANGFDGREICALARYTGISDRVSSFGVYGFFNFQEHDAASMLVGQVLWYFIEGVNRRSHERVVRNQPGVLHYSVPIDGEILSFYKSSRTERWWIEIPFISGIDNKLKRHTLLPCDYRDYENACNQIMPERWYKARRKNEI